MQKGEFIIYLALKIESSYIINYLMVTALLRKKKNTKETHLNIEKSLFGDFMFSRKQYRDLQ